MDAENLVLTGIRSPDRPESSQMLYRLRYGSPLFSGYRRNLQYVSEMYHLTVVSGELQNAWNFTTMSSHLPGMVNCTCSNKRLTRIRCSKNISVFILNFVLVFKAIKCCVQCTAVTLVCETDCQQLCSVQLLHWSARPTVSSWLIFRRARKIAKSDY
jgi:hypothetical protein